MTTTTAGPRRVRVELPGIRGYDVVIGRDLLAGLTEHIPLAADFRHAALVVQPSVTRAGATVARALSTAGIDTTAVDVPDGEAAKDLAVASRIWSELARIPLGRRDLVVAVGGGAVGDLAGFVAATWHRGVALLHVPTTLLAQVDAAVGGKTAVNLPEGKNLVGAFHQPVGVLDDVSVLASLPPRELASGLAEVLKSGLVGDPTIVDLLEADPGAARAGHPDTLVELVHRSVAVKARVVAADEREGEGGPRTHLNLGHTYGHALETATGYRQLRHGEAVAVGLVVALRLGARLGVTPAALVERVEAVLAALGLPTRPPSGINRSALLDAMARDKKVRHALRFVLVEAPGRVTVAEAVDAGVLAAVLDDVERA